MRRIFAAELLLDDEEVMELLCDGYTYPQAAHMLDIDTNLLLIKVDSMNKRGMKFKKCCPSVGFFITEKSAFAYADSADNTSADVLVRFFSCGCCMPARQTFLRAVCLRGS